VSVFEELACNGLSVVLDLWQAVSYTPQFLDVIIERPGTLSEGVKAVSFAFDDINGEVVKEKLFSQFLYCPLCGIRGHVIVEPPA
jgi:hypothetical protein